MNAKQTSNSRQIKKNVFLCYSLASKQKLKGRYFVESNQCNDAFKETHYYFSLDKVVNTEWVHYRLFFWCFYIGILIKKDK